MVFGVLNETYLVPTGAGI